jgi:hypothetical protein
VFIARVPVAWMRWEMSSVAPALSCAIYVGHYFQGGLGIRLRAALATPGPP